MATDYQECKGCDPQTACVNPKYILNNEEISCPCIICLVKVICVKLCDDYRKFLRNHPTLHTTIYKVAFNNKHVKRK